MEESLESKLLSDLREMGVVIHSRLDLRAYSKTMWGCYYCDRDLIRVYVYEDRGKKRLIPYPLILKTVLHEYTHSLQHKSSSYKRRKGLMHDGNFYLIYNNLLKRAEKAGVLYNEAV